MSPSLSVITTLAATLSVANAAMGPAFSTGPVGSNSWIRESVSTLVIPNAPTNNKGDSSLWVGMGTSKGDLIQSIIENNNQKDWSLFAYTLLSTGPTSQMPVQTVPTKANAADKVTVHYKYNDNTGNYTQTVMRNNVQVHKLSTNDGHALGWGSAVECAENNCGTMPAHHWINTIITLDSADPVYDRTLGKGPGVTGTMKTADKGVTWTVADIYIPEFTFGK
ncbi:hypothetical protein CC86DRAFT_318062 [Ophiobolus disseminans]|uniref:Concanavalin A-like lectin/glucanase n=1 Tax=Ophiobolus disseminans TaxID=1469910 RepID=A0A6A7A8K8_9PLEO|nr:hypothetical protein CC86DRAFT_318062 [Ophiobolus disseminans]